VGTAQQARSVLVRNRHVSSVKPGIGLHWRSIGKDVRHSGDKNHPLSTKSTELNMLNFGGNVDCNKLSTSTLSPVCIRTSDKVEDRLSTNDFAFNTAFNTVYCE